MQWLIGQAARWIVRHLLSFLIIVAILVIGKLAYLESVVSQRSHAGVV